MFLDARLGAPAAVPDAEDDDLALFHRIINLIRPFEQLSDPSAIRKGHSSSGCIRRNRAALQYISTYLVCNIRVLVLLGNESDNRRKIRTSLRTQPNS